jgi:Tfp pilus assembly protein PilF
MFRKRTAILLLICAGLLLYLNSLTNAFISDDRNQILNNPALHSLSSIPQFFFGSTYYSGGTRELGGLYYRPLMMASYDLLYAISGTSPVLFHLFQIALHIGNTILVFVLFGFFFSDIVAFFLALLFLIHPINTEAVVYIADLQDVLFVFFGLLALIIFLYNRKNIFQWKTRIAVGICLLLSLFSKETGIVFFITIILYSFVTKQKHKFSFFLSLFGSFLTYIFFRFSLAHIHITKGIVLAPIASATISQRLLNMPYIFFTYIKRFFFPITLSSSDYSIITSPTFFDFYVPLFITMCFIAGIFAIDKWIAKKHKKYTKQFIFFASWFVIGLLPHLQIIPLDQTIAERWFYFSAIGMLGMIGTIVVCIKITQYRLQTIGYACITIVCILLGTRTVLRNFDWRDGVTLYSHDIQTTKKNFLLDNALATELLIDGQYKQAKPYVMSSIQQYPFYANLNNAAIISLSEKNIPQTKQYLQQALMHNPNYAVYENYANFLVAYYSPQEAVVFTKKALIKYPQNAKLLFDLGKASWKVGNTKTALEALKKSYAIDHNEPAKKLLEEIESAKK